MRKRFSCAEDTLSCAAFQFGIRSLARYTWVDERVNKSLYAISIKQVLVGLLSKRSKHSGI